MQEGMCYMCLQEAPVPQLHMYVSDEVAERLRREAEARDKSLSKYLAEIVEREFSGGWPDGYFEDVVGGWIGEPLERPEQAPLQERDSISRG